MENKQLVSPSRQCSSTPVGFGHGLISEEQCGNPGASADLAPADVYLSPRLNSALKGRRFCDATVMIKYATEERKRLSQNGMFPTPLQSLAEVYCCTRAILKKMLLK